MTTDEAAPAIADENPKCEGDLALAVAFDIADPRFRPVLPFYVYELIDPRSDCAFYVGRGRLPGIRWRSHLGDAFARPSKSAPATQVRAFIDEGVRPLVRIVGAFSSESESSDLEMSHLASTRLQGLSPVNQVAPTREATSWLGLHSGRSPVPLWGATPTKVLQILLAAPDQWFMQSELATRTRRPRQQVFSALKRIVGEGVAEVQVLHGRPAFRANRANPYFDDFCRIVERSIASSPDLGA